MHEEEPKKEPNQLAKLGYEASDFNAPKVARGFLYFLLFSTGCIGLAGVVIKFIAPNFWVVQPQISGLRIPPPPKLQNNVAVIKDIREVRGGEYRRLNSYGWIDYKKGIVHIPIEQAINMTLSRGLLRSSGASSKNVLQGGD